MKVIYINTDSETDGPSQRKVTEVIVRVNSRAGIRSFMFLTENLCYGAETKEKGKKIEAFGGEHELAKISIFIVFSLK